MTKSVKVDNAPTKVEVPIISEPPKKVALPVNNAPIKIDPVECPSVIGQTKPDAVIAFLDIETAPSVGYVWQKWETNVIDFIEDGYVLSYSIKFVGQKGIKVRGLPDYSETWERNNHDDRDLLRDLRDDLDKAAVIIAHNGDKFDIPQIRARMVVHGMRPPSPFQTVDTLKIARNRFDFKSNKLDDLCRDLGIGRKLPHTGFHLWKGCMDGDLAAFRLMKRYNRHDVLLLEELYYRFLPWTSTHPNVNKSADLRCLRCGSDKVKFEGFRFTALRKKSQYHCLNCAGWFEGSAKKQ